MKNRLAAGSAPATFAHLMGAPAGRARADKDDDDKEMKARKARRAAEDKRRADEDKKRKDEDAKRAEEDDTLEPGDTPHDDPTDEDPDCPECDGEGTVDGETCPLCGGDGEVHSPDQPQDKDDDDSVDNMDDEARKASRQGKKAERSRWAKVLGHKVAAGRVGPACAMLANGDMNAAAIVATLQSMPTESVSRGGLRDRMAAERPRNPGPDAQGSKGGGKEPTFAERVIAAGQEARGEKPS